ncbi:MAG: hypothetical protein ACKOA2_07650 [Ilumatobacteraceae bacterium]
MLIAYDWWNPREFPIWNQAFLFSFVLSTAMALVAIPYAKRRPKDRQLTWGEAMIASTYVFGVMFVAFGVVPHQYIDYADKELGWNKTYIIYGPFDILKPQALGGPFPFTMSYEAIRDIIVIVIHLWYFGLLIYLWMMWQKRGERPAGTEVATSTFGRPLVKKG